MFDSSPLLLLSEEVAEANPTFRAIGGEGEYTAKIDDLISITVNVIVRIIYDTRTVGAVITFIFFKNLTPLFKQSY